MAFRAINGAPFVLFFSFLRLGLALKLERSNNEYVLPCDDSRVGERLSSARKVTDSAAAVVAWPTPGRAV